MPESNLTNFKQEFINYIEKRKSSIEKRWAGNNGYPGRATMSYKIEESNNSIKAIMTFAGQKMWMMEFGRGHDDHKGYGVQLRFTKTKMFKDYASSSVFSEGRKFSDVERYKKNQYRKAILKKRKRRALAKENLSKKQIKEIKTKYSTQGGQHISMDRTGGKAYNIVRIFTRAGSYSDIDSPNNVHRGSGLGGKYGLNTEAFTFQNGKYKNKSLAREPYPVISKGEDSFPIQKLYMLGEKAVWKFNSADKLYEALTKGFEADVKNLVEKAMKNK
jgi:hypothetical protein